MKPDQKPSCSVVEQVNSGSNKLAEYMPFKMPPTCWYFASESPCDAIIPDSEAWSCIFEFVSEIASGKKLCLSERNPGCSGASLYLGFREPGVGAGGFLAGQERFKKNVELGNAFYDEIKALPAKNDFIVLSQVEDLENNIIPEVITLWVDATSLSGLITLANYDRATNNNVIIPFASGCQSIWTIPYKEKFQRFPKGVVGLVDPAARVPLPPEVLSFSMPVNRFIELVDNVEGSFLELRTWKGLIRQKDFGSLKP